MDATAIAIFAGALLVSAGSPGPSVAALVSRVLTNGWRDVAPFIVAMWLGEVTWLLAALAGLAALAELFAVAFTVIKWCGIAYLLWLAVQMWRQPVEWAPTELPTGRSSWSMFLAGLAVTIGNPKIMVFYLALLPTLLDLSSATFAHWAVLAVTTLVILVITDGLWILAAERARRLLRSRTARRIANRLSALTLAGAAAFVAARA